MSSVGSTRSQTPLAAASDVGETPVDYWVRYRWRYHLIILVVSAVVLSAAMVCSVDGVESISVPVLGKLPGVCVWKRAFGMDCPGCGLTRCFVSLADGEINQAWHFSPIGLLMFAVLLYQFPYRSIQIWRLVRGCRDYRHSIRSVNLLVWGIVVGLIVQWIWRQVL